VLMVIAEPAGCRLFAVLWGVCPWPLPLKRACAARAWQDCWLRLAVGLLRCRCRSLHRLERFYGAVAMRRDQGWNS